MKRVYQETRFNGTYDYVHAYLDAAAAFLAAADESRRISTYLVPDGWGVPGFSEWTPEEAAAGEAAGRQRLLPDGSLREWSASDSSPDAEPSDCGYIGHATA